MPDFIHPSLLAVGLPIIALPLLIHLINRMRQKRVQWAAMEFLLQSQRRNRTWVMLKQLLLLLTRMLAIAAVVLLVAQPVLRSSFGALFGGSRTHHIVLLDDSFSMSDRFSGTTAFDKGKELIRRLSEQAAKQSTPQQFTIVRFSQAASGSQPDMYERNIDSSFRPDIDALLTSANFSVSQAATSPSDAVDAIANLLARQTNAYDNRVIYLVSDFRTKDWNEATALRTRLAELADAGVQLRLIDCVDAARPNLAISGLKPATGTKAVGVNIPVELAVTNFGQEPRRGVIVNLEQDGQARPAISIDEILPGETVTQLFETKFLSAGEHRVRAQLEQDGVDADNNRYAVLDVPRAVPVLVIDGSRERTNDAFYLTKALAPDPNVATGIEPLEETVRYLGSKPLESFQAIYLLNVGRLEETAVRALEDYVRAGGGLAIFLGPQSDVDFVNGSLYQDGKGLFPAPLVASTELLVNRAQRAPDLQLADHPVFARFSGQRNSDIDAVTISKYFAVQKNWAPADNSTASVIARLRNGAPLAIEQKFGQGNVVAFLTTAGPNGWNNWGRDNASYVVAMLELQAYLASAREPYIDRQVGKPIDLSFDGSRYASAVRFVTPASGADAVFALEAQRADGLFRTSLDKTSQSGFYEAQLTSTTGNVEQRTFAVNVRPEEGNLATLSSDRLAESLEGIDYNYAQVDDVGVNARNLAGFHLSEGLLYALLGLLLVEQVLAYITSYHPMRPRGASK